MSSDERAQGWRRFARIPARWWRALLALLAVLLSGVLWMLLVALDVSLELRVVVLGLLVLVLVIGGLLLRRDWRILRSQRQRLTELGLLNEISRAIIRSELDVDALCDLVYEEASKVVDTRWFHLGLLEGNRYTLKVRIQDNVRLPPLSVQLQGEGGIIGWMLRSGRSLLVEDFATEMDWLPARPTYQAEHPPRSGVYIPLLAGGDVLGTISIQSSTPRAFSAGDLRVLSLVADQSAVAIAKARAYDSARRRAQQLATISEVGRQATAILELDQLLPSVARRIRASFGYFQVNIFLVDHAAHEVVLRATTDPDSEFWRRHNQRQPIGNGIVGFVASSGEPLLVNDVGQEPRFVVDQERTASEMAVPLRVGSEMLGVLDVQSDQLGAFDANDFFVLQTLADQIAIAIDSANIFAAQQEEAWVLNALLQSAENIARAGELAQHLALTVRLPPLLVGADRSICFLWDRDTRSFVPAAVWGLTLEQRATIIGQPLPEAEAPILSEVLLSGEPRELPDALQTPELLPGVISVCSSGSLLLLPLTARGAVLGVLLLDDCSGQSHFSERQKTIASGIARQVASAIEAAQLATAEAERQRLEQELNVAREIQTSLLPPAPPQPPGWQVAGAWRSARQVGGDFYDFWTLPGGQLGFVIADVSDKGVPAALFMALSRSLVRAAALDGSSPARALTRANRWITRDSQSCMFVTLFYGLLDTDSGALTFSKAGHNPPLLFRAASDEVQQLITAGIALGVLEDGYLAEASVTMEPGDLLVCYTDGVTEAINDAEEEFGLERLIQVVRQAQSCSPEEVVNIILGAVAEHAGSQPPFDDMTLTILRRAELSADLGHGLHG